MPNLVGIDDDYGDDILARDAVLASMASSGFSGALAQGGIWPPLDDSRRPRLTLQRRRNHLRVVPVGVERSTLDALMPVMERLAELMSMPRGWNSYDANPISGTALRRTIEFLLEHVAFGIDHPAVVPTIRGGLQLEWHNNGLDIEVEVAPDGPVTFFVEDGATEEPIEMHLTGNENRIRQWLTRASG